MLRAYVGARRYVYGQEVQAIATAQDDDLVIWKKVQCCVATTVTLTAHSEERCAMQASNNPVIPGPPPSLSVVGFRDPMVQWQPDQQQYRMLLGSGIRNSHGTSLMYTATDLDGPWSYRYAGWRQGVVPGGTDPSGLCGGQSRIRERVVQPTVGGIAGTPVGMSARFHNGAVGIHDHGCRTRKQRV